VWITAALAALLMWWAHKLSRDIIRALEAHGKRGDASDLLDSDYPVFSRARIIEAYQNSLTASRHLQSIEGTVLRDAAFSSGSVRSYSKRPTSRTGSVSTESWDLHS